jgi:hypothetical protein
MPGGGKGGSSSTVTVHNGPIAVDADSTVEVVGLNDIKVTAKLEPTPLRTESKQELVLPQPLRTESRLDTKADVTSDSRNAMSVDLKPVALDVCLNTSAKLPQGQICQPFSYHVGLTWFGVELFGVNFGGESRMVMQDLPKKPAVEWPAQQQAPSPAPHHDAASPERAFRAAGERGLRVRVK